MMKPFAIAAAFLALSSLFAGAPASSQTLGQRALTTVILPGYAAFRSEADRLRLASLDCDTASLRAAFHAAFDSWLRIEPIAFGPVEISDRRFAIAFWPDTKGFVARSLRRLERAQDPVVADPKAFAEISVAARGFPALERLLWSDSGRDAFQSAEGAYRCQLAQAIAADLLRIATALDAEWRAAEGIAASFASPSKRRPQFRSEADVARALFASLDGMIEKNASLRMGRPLGKFGQERPRRAETWRSGRAMRNVRVSVEALANFHRAVFSQTLNVRERDRIDRAFTLTLAALEDTPDSFEDAKGAPGVRIRFEAAQSRLTGLKLELREIVAPALGVTLGFNALDGD